MMKSLEERLITIGYHPCCAQEIVEDYQSISCTEELATQLARKEYEIALHRSIVEHVQEVLG